MLKLHCPVVEKLEQCRTWCLRRRKCYSLPQDVFSIFVQTDSKDYDEIEQAIQFLHSTEYGHLCNQRQNPWASVSLGTYWLKLCWLPIRWNGETMKPVNTESCQRMTQGQWGNEASPTRSRPYANAQLSVWLSELCKELVTPGFSYNCSSVPLSVEKDLAGSSNFS